MCWRCYSIHLCYAISQKLAFYLAEAQIARKNRTLLEPDPGHLPTAKMELFVIISSILNVGKGPKPAFDYNGIS